MISRKTEDRLSTVAAIIVSLLIAGIVTFQVGRAVGQAEAARVEVAR